MKYFLSIILILCSFYIHSETLVFSSSLDEDNYFFKAQQILYSEISSKIPNLDIELVSLPLERCRINLLNGSTDGDSGRTDNVYLNNDPVIRVNIPIYSSDYVLYSTNIKLKLFKNDNLWLYTFVIRTGDIVATQYVEKNKLNYRTVSSLEQGIKMVQNSRVDIFLTIREYVKDILIDVDSNISYLKPPLFTFDMYLFLNTKNKKYIKEIEEVINKMENSGRLKEIFSKVK